MHLNIQETLDFAKSIAIEAGKIAMQYQKDGFKVSHKTQINNLVTEADIACENYITEQILTKFPDHAILGEENGANESQSDYLWLIDPIDGTTNFAHGYPFFAVSIALSYQDEIILGVTHAPMLNETYFAGKNLGAYLNDQPIQVSTNQSLELSLLATGFPPDRRSNDYTKAITLFTKAQNFIHGVRRSGSACLELAFTACGRLDGFFEIGLKPWDVATGIILIQEAGGQITNFDGKNYKIKYRTIIASNGIIHQELIDYLK
jgi:myo-inositol-1(or 4)-monophosphatase